MCSLKGFRFGAGYCIPYGARKDSAAGSESVLGAEGMTPAKEEDVCSHVKVVVRVRPESQKEKQGSFSRVVRVIDQHVLVFDPKEEESDPQAQL